eukprot:457972-Hanusia_phi.AAC.1
MPCTLLLSRCSDHRLPSRRPPACVRRVHLRGTIVPRRAWTKPEKRDQPCQVATMGAQQSATDGHHAEDQGAAQAVHGGNGDDLVSLMLQEINIPDGHFAFAGLGFNQGNSKRKRLNRRFFINISRLLNIFSIPCNGTLSDEFEGIKTGKFITWGPLPIVDKDSLMVNREISCIMVFRQVSGPFRQLRLEPVAVKQPATLMHEQKSKGKRRRAIEKELRKSMSQTTTVILQHRCLQHSYNE